METEFIINLLDKNIKDIKEKYPFSIYLEQFYKLKKEIMYIKQNEKKNIKKNFY